MKNEKNKLVKKRLLTNAQSKGNLGKSTFFEFLACYLDSRSVVWTGSDTDSRHATFSYRRPNQVKQYTSDNVDEAKGAFANLFRRFLADEAPVHIIDCAAQSDAAFVAAVEQLDLFTRCSERDARMTMMLYPTDEYESMSNFADMVEFAEDAVDYVIVHNPARSRGDMYKGSALERTLNELGAKSIVLPRLLPETFLAMERAESIAGRGITFAEFATPGLTSMDPILMGDLQWALNNIFAQYNSIAKMLLTTELAASVTTNSNKPADRPNERSPKLRLNFGE